MSGFGQLLQAQHKTLIRRHALICLGAVLVAAGLYVGLGWQREQTRQALDQDNLTLQAAQAELADLQSAKQELDENLGRYQALEREGFVGNGDRIAWAEALLDLQRELNLPELSFELAPQKPMNAAPVDPDLLGLEEPTPSAVLGPLAHDMRIRSKGMHEGELLRLIEALRERRVGYFRVNQCQATRVSGEVGLYVDCALRWVTYAPTPSDASGEPAEDFEAL